MKSGLAVRADNTEFVLESLRQLSGVGVLVGVPENKTGREDGSSINNAELDYLHSAGATVEIDGTAVTFPPCPSLEMRIKDSKPRTTAYLRTTAATMLKEQTEAVMRELKSAGQIARDTTEVVISAGDRLYPPSEETLGRRRAEGILSDKPLYIHGYLLCSINCVVRRK